MLHLHYSAGTDWNVSTLDLHFTRDCGFSKQVFHHFGLNILDLQICFMKLQSSNFTILSILKTLLTTEFSRFLQTEPQKQAEWLFKYYNGVIAKYWTTGKQPSTRPLQRKQENISRQSLAEVFSSCSSTKIRIRSHIIWLVRGEVLSVECTNLGDSGLVLTLLRQCEA